MNHQLSCPIKVNFDHLALCKRHNLWLPACSLQLKRPASCFWYSPTLRILCSYLDSHSSPAAAATRSIDFLYTLPRRYTNPTIGKKRPNTHHIWHLSFFYAECRKVRCGFAVTGINIVPIIFPTSSSDISPLSLCDYFIALLSPWRPWNHC